MDKKTFVLLVALAILAVFGTVASVMATCYRSRTAKEVSSGVKYPSEEDYKNFSGGIGEEDPGYAWGEGY